MRRRALHVTTLTAVWVLLWGRLSVANVIGGALVASILLAVFPLERRRDAAIVVRPLATLHLAAHVGRQLVVSNLDMSVRILRPRPRLVTAVVECPLRTGSPGIITAVTNILALGPGTMVVDVLVPVDAPAVLLVHVLRADAPERVRTQVAQLERLVVAAFGSPAEVAACRGPVPAGAGRP